MQPLRKAFTVLAVSLIASVALGDGYPDGRPAAALRLEAEDHGVVLRHGDGPDRCDVLGARDAWVFRDGDTYFMHYDAAGPKGWLASLAVSKDLTHWEKKGPVLDFGARGEDDQMDLLTPKAGWACDTSESAPVLYRDKTIIEREEFAMERAQVLSDAKVLKPFAELMLDSQPSLRMELTKTAERPMGGTLIVSFSPLVKRLGHVNIFELAAKQVPVMEDFVRQTHDDDQAKAEHQRYLDSAQEWRRIMESA